MASKRSRICETYGVTPGSAPETLADFISRIGTGPAYPYPVLATDISMFIGSWQAQAVTAGLDPDDPGILQALSRRAAITKRRR